MVIKPFVISEYITCKKFIKLYYDMLYPIDMSLIKKLSVLGDLKVIEFSKFSPLSKDCFVIKGENELAIQGVLGAKLMYYVVPKLEEEKVNQLEEIILDWASVKNNTI